MLIAIILPTTLISGCYEIQKSDSNQVHEQAGERIISLNGTLTEILCKLGKKDELVGVDVTSTFPPPVREIENVGHFRTLSSEGLLSLNPTLVLGFYNEIKPEITEHLNTVGVKTMLFSRDFSLEGSKNLISEVCNKLEKPEMKNELFDQIDSGLHEVVSIEQKPSVLFIYARGAGNLTVAGEKTAPFEMIRLAGCKNAVSGFEQFKPLTSESLIAANPDIILLFESGLESMGGEEGLLKIPGIAQTTAGKNRHFVEMDGLLLTGFSPRLGSAVAELSKKLKDEIES